MSPTYKSHMLVDIVLGCSFGDEGKGKVVYDLCKKMGYNLCVRFNGSGNAGHTIYVNDKKVVLHQLPVGTLVSTMYSLISSDCLIHIENLRREIHGLKECGIDLSGRLFVSKATHIITEDCIEYDRQNNLVGTTGSGIGPTYSKKMLRTGKRVEDYMDVFAEMGIEVVDMRYFWNMFRGKVGDQASVIMEGAQGFELDINWTNHYPYCTSSSCTLAGAINCGIKLSDIRDIYGISKIYDTYVGKMEFQPPNDEDLNRLGDIGHEYGSTTGRRRQCNWLNLDNLCHALDVNNCNVCVINKNDVLMELGVYCLYFHNKLHKFDTFPEMQNFIEHGVKTKVGDNVRFLFSYSPYGI